MDAEKQPRLVFKSSRDIPKGEELTFDYCDLNPTSRGRFPWLRDE